MKNIKRKPEGHCALTNDFGLFVKSHIIPEGLSETLWRGHPLTQMGQHGKPIRRWTSWYDTNLVTQVGEDILQSYDDWGIKFLKERKLIWRSWGPMQRLSTSDHVLIPKTSHGLRTLEYVDGPKLRLFLLSILWRAAASTLWEFGNVQIEKADLERLRKMVRDGNPEPYEFFPVYLIQFSTRALLPFNQVVIKSNKREPVLCPDGSFDGKNSISIEYFRSYFDGLAAGFNINEDPAHYLGAEKTFVNKGSKLIVQTMPAEASAFINDFNFHAGMPVTEKHLKERFEAEWGKEASGTLDR